MPLSTMPLSSVDPSATSASGGEGLSLRAGDRSLDELLRIAAAAARAQTRVELTGVRSKALEDLIRITVTGGGCVVFGREPEEPRGETVKAPRRRWWRSRPTG